MIDHLCVEGEFLVEDGLVICCSYSLLGAYAVAVVDGFPLDEVAAGKFYYYVAFLDESLKFTHLHC